MINRPIPMNRRGSGWSRDIGLEGRSLFSNKHPQMRAEFQTEMGYAMTNAPKPMPSSNNFPDLAGWLGGPFHDVVNATAAYVAAYAAISIANILAPSIFLSALRLGLMVGFVAKVINVSESDEYWLDKGCLSFIWRAAAGLLLAAFATFAAMAAVEAGVVQLDSSRAEKAVKISNIYRDYYRAGINNGCYDPDVAAIKPVCKYISEKYEQQLQSVNRPPKLPKKQ